MLEHVFGDCVASEWDVFSGLGFKLCYWVCGRDGLGFVLGFVLGVLGLRVWTVRFGLPCLVWVGLD